MPSGSGDFEGPFCAFLPFDVGEVEHGAVGLTDLRLWPRQHLAPFEVIGKLDQGASRDDLHFGACPGRLRSTGCRADQALAAPIGSDCCRQHARNWRQRTIKPELTEDRVSVEGVMRNGADRRHQPERDRQVIMAAFLREVGRGQIDDDAPGRQCKARRDHGRANPFAGF
jgi:hypothetical protein